MQHPVQHGRDRITFSKRNLLTSKTLGFLRGYLFRFAGLLQVAL